MCSSNPVQALGTVASFGAAAGRYVGKKALSTLTPDIPQLPTPPTPQDEKDPDATALRRRRNVAPSTLLTGPAGITSTALNSGAPTLLGG